MDFNDANETQGDGKNRCGSAVLEVSVPSPPQVTRSPGELATISSLPEEYVARWPDKSQPLCSAVLEVPSPPRVTRAAREPATISALPEPDYIPLLRQLRQNPAYDDAFTWVDDEYTKWYKTLKETYYFVLQNPTKDNSSYIGLLSDSEYKKMLSQIKRGTNMEYEASYGSATNTYHDAGIHYQMRIEEIERRRVAGARRQRSRRNRNETQLEGGIACDRSCDGGYGDSTAATERS